MLEDFQYQGSWWLPEYPENKVSGILRFIHNQKIILELIGCFPVNHSSIILGNALNNKGGTQEKITLYGVSFKSQYGHPDFNDVSKSLFNADFLLIGEHFIKSDDIEFSSLSANFTSLEEWLGNLPFKTEYKDNITIKYQFPENHRIKINSLDSELSIYHSFNDESDDFRKVTVYNTAFLKVIPKEPEKIEWFTQAIRDLQSFLALVTNLRVYPKSLIAFGKEKQVPYRETVEGEIQYKNRSTLIKIYYILPNYFPLEDSLPIEFHILLHFPRLKDNFELYIDNWFKNAEKLRPIYDLYFSSFYDASINPLIQFLSLAQAIEVYHREVVGGKYLSDESYEIIKKSLYEAIPTNIAELNKNPELLRSFKDSLKSRVKYGYQYSLRKRLKDLVNKFWEGCLENFIENKNKFPEGITDLRNYLTHYDKDDLNNALAKFGIPQADVSDLCNYLNPRLRLLVIILLLDQVGIERNALYEVINKYPEFEPLKPSFWENRSTSDKEY
jgi:hypothetical protein